MWCLLGILGLLFGVFAFMGVFCCFIIFISFLSGNSSTGKSDIAFDRFIIVGTIVSLALSYTLMSMKFAHDEEVDKNNYIAILKSEGYSTSDILKSQNEIEYLVKNSSELFSSKEINFIEKKAKELKTKEKQTQAESRFGDDGKVSDISKALLKGYSDKENKPLGEVSLEKK